MPLFYTVLLIVQLFYTRLVHCCTLSQRPSNCATVPHSSTDCATVLHSSTNCATVPHPADHRRHVLIPIKPLAQDCNTSTPAPTPAPTTCILHLHPQYVSHTKLYPVCYNKHTSLATAKARKIIECGLRFIQKIALTTDIV